MKKLSHKQLSSIYAGSGSRFFALSLIRTVEYAFDQWIARRERKIAKALAQYEMDRNALIKSDFYASEGSS